jgi:hypothetical protein
VSRAELELDALELEPGQSVRMDCPFCKQPGKTMSLTHREDGTLLYHCYRASCVGGGVLGNGIATYRAPRTTPLASRAKQNIEAELRWPEGSGECWGFYVADLIAAGVMWHDLTQRLALPVYAPDFRLRGRVLRCMPGDSRTPKALMWMYENGPTLGWNRVRGDTTVVVEDLPSCLKLGECGYRAVALNGTHMTEEAIQELDRNTTNVIWALDRDAFAKAQEHEKQLRLYFGKSMTLLLERDFKDMGWKEIDECLSETYWGQSSEAETRSSESAD